MEKKLLWVSPFSLHDTSSGAAIQAKSMLESLAKSGIKVTALGSFVFDSPLGTSTFPHLEKELKERGTQPITIEDKGIAYHYTTCMNRHLSAFTHDESWRFFTYFSALCNTFCPDIIMGYGVGTTGVAIQAEAKRRGIPFVYSLHNGNHPYYDFNDCDLLITDSQATANLYAQRDRLNVQPVGVFLNKEDYVAVNKEPQYITFINPDPTKGISIFAKLAMAAKEELPDVKFLVIESRGIFAESIKKLHLPDSTITPYNAKMFSNVMVANHTRNMKEVYRITKALIAPSLWHESWGRVVTEAIFNEIPCIVSNRGGLPEVVGEAGFVVAAPQECIQDHLRIPTDEEIAPWLNALKEIIHKDFSQHCQNMIEKHSIEKSTERILAILEPLFAKKASQNPAIIRNGILRMQADGRF